MTTTRMNRTDTSEDNQRLVMFYAAIDLVACSEGVPDTLHCRCIAVLKA